MTVDSEQQPHSNSNNHQNGHPPPVIVQETDDEDDVLLPTENEAVTSTAITLLEVDEETLNSGAEG